MINMATFKSKMARMHVLDPWQDKSSYLYHSSDILVGNLSLSKQLLALMLSTLACPYYYSFESGGTNKLPATMSVLCQTWSPSEALDAWHAEP